MEGFLFKRGDLVKTWRVRYFVLQLGPSPSLTYYRAIESGEGPNKSWYLEGCSVHYAEPTGLKRYRFILEDTNGHRTHLAAQTAQARKEWMYALAAAAARSGSAGASSSNTASGEVQGVEPTPVSSSTAPSRPHSSGLPGRAVQPPTAATAAAPQPPVQDTFLTPLPLGKALRRVSADSVGSVHASQPQLRKITSQKEGPSTREGLARSPSGTPRGTLFTPRALGQQQLHRKQSFFSAIKDVFMGSAPSDSLSTGSEEGSAGDSSTSNAYNASLKPLKSTLPGQAGDIRPAEAILEQFDRAQQYVLKNKGEFTAEQQAKLQGWMAAVQASRDKGVSTAAVAAAAMFVLVVTRTNDQWASWSEHDNMFVSPENMLSEVQKWPSRPTLEDLKECLDYCSTSWVGLYCRLGGAHLLLQALKQHRDAALEGQAQAHDAVLASLQCMQALTSGGGGMDAAIAAPHFVGCLCSVLDPDDQDCSKLVVEILTKLCLYSAEGYCAAIQTILGEPLDALTCGSPQAAAVQSNLVPPPPPPQLRPPSRVATLGSTAALPPAPPPPPQLLGVTGPCKAPHVPPPLSRPQRSLAPPPPPPPPPPRNMTGPVPLPPPPPPPPPPATTSPASAAAVSAQTTPAAMCRPTMRPPPVPPPPPCPPPGIGVKQPLAGSTIGSGAAPPPPPPPPPPLPQVLPAAKQLAAQSQLMFPPGKQCSSSVDPATSELTLTGELCLPESSNSLSPPGLHYPPPPGPPPAAVATTAAPSSATLLPAGHMHDAGHLNEAEVLSKLKDTLPAYKGSPEFVSIVASASTPPSSNKGEVAPALAKQQAPEVLEYCTTIVAMMTWDHLDSGLCQHVITLINRALDSPDGPHKGFSKCLALRQRLVAALLDRGLMRVITDLQDLVQESLFQDLETMKDTIKRLLAPPKRPAANSPAAPPPAAPPPPKRPPPPLSLRRPSTPLLPPHPKLDPGPRPSRKMKSFFWDKLPENRLQQTFWADHPPSYASVKTDEVEDLFQAMQKSTVKKSGATGRQKLAVLDLKRATAIGIRMSRLRVAWQRIPHCIVKLDSHAFQTADDVRAVLHCLPTQDEANMLQSYVRAGGSFEGLSPAELFCLALMKIPRVEARLSTFLTRFEARQQLAEVKGILEGHQAAHRELKGSPCMAAALEQTLAIGNFLNWGTRLGPAAGFRLRNLPKLQDTRSLDGKTTLLTYIARQLSTGPAPAALLAEEVPHVVGSALKVSVQEVTDMVDKVSLAMDLVRSELKRAEGRVTVTIACQHPHFMQQQQAAQDAIHGKTSAHPGQIQTQPNGQESPTLRQMQGVESPHQSQLCRQEEEGLPSRELQQHKFVLVELLSDNYRDVMSQTLVGVESDLKLCRHLLQQCKESFSSMVSYYGENAQAFANDAVFWSDVITFVDSFTACQKQLRQQIQEQADMARRKQLRRGRSHTTSPEASPSASPTPSRPASPPINPTAARSARASHSPSKPPSAASASLGQSPTSLDKQAASCAGPAAASPSPAPAELTAPAVLPSSLPAKAYAFDTSPTGATSDASQANQTCLLSADPSVMHHHAARQATEACVPKGVAGSPSDAELARLQQRSPQSHTAGHVLQHPTGINQRSPVPGTGEGSASRADFVSAVKPHPRTAFAKPGSHQGVILSPQAVVHLHAVKTVMSHRLDFSEDTD